MVATSDYERAESYLPWHVSKRLFATSIEPHWTGDGDRFWYSVQTRDGKRFVLVDPDAGTKQEAFDHTRLAAALAAAGGESVDASALPFGDLTFTGGGEAVGFDAFGKRWRCELGSYQCVQGSVDDPGELWSPARDRAAFVRDHDLWIRTTATGAETRLTHDGEANRDYATALPSPLPPAGIKAGRPWPKPGPAVLWSPDGKRLLTHRIDARDAGRFTLVQSVPTDGSTRPKSFSYVYPLPGEENVAHAELLIFDAETGRRVEVGVPPLERLYYGTPLPIDAEAGRGRAIWWSEDGSRCYVLRTERGFRKLVLYAIDAETGATRVVVEEADETPVDPGITVGSTPCVRVLGDGAEVLWYSQRDGWAHLYLCAGGPGETGKPIRQLTSGEWAVADVVHVDEAARHAYVLGVGREPGRDPYERLLYRVSLDGGEPVLLTPEAGSHTVTFAPSGRFFVTTRARMDTAPVTELRSVEGETTVPLEIADLDDLLEAGWSFPERFLAKARRPHRRRRHPDQTLHVRPGPAVSRRRRHLRRSADEPGAGLARRDRRELLAGASDRRAGFRRGDGRRARHAVPLEGVPRRGVSQPRGRRPARPHLRVA
ncbi:beta-propeller domain-containing protein [Flindersiella endophytica]